MTNEAAAVVDDGTGVGAGGDTVTVGEVDGDTEGQGKSPGVIDVATVVSEGQQQQQQLWSPSWECC